MKYILTMLFLMIGVLLFAQNKENSTLKGIVTDISNSPVIYASVVLEGTNYGAVTNDEGQFTIKAPKGKYTLKVFYIGYETYQTSLELKENETELVKVILQENTTSLQEVLLIGKTNAQRLKESAESVEVIEIKEVKFQAADLGEVMARSEGVSVQRSGGLGSNTRFALNGLSGDKIRFFYEGIPLNFSPYSFGIANVPINAIKQIEVYKGVVPIQFGADALGGAINLVSPTIKTGWSGSASYQVGSFNTHQATANLAYASDSSGWFVNVCGFFDYTKNNYKIDVAIPNEKGKLTQQTVERFHDGYRAFGTNIKVGIRDKKWADELSIEGYYGSFYNELQNSQSPGLLDYPQLGINKAVAGSPFGDVVFTNFSQGLNLHYKVSLPASADKAASKWTLDTKAGYNYNERTSIDTSKNLYNWFGEIIRIQNQPGEFGDGDHLITKSRNYFARQQIGYQISDKHSLKLAIAPTYTYRNGDDLLIDGKFDPALDDGYLFDLVTGLEYKGELFNGKLQVIAFGKNYRQNIRNESVDPSIEGLQVVKRVVSNFGAGTGLRYAWTSRFATKLSYEYAYRLPRQDEVFSDGQLIGGNLDLKPENSHNVNIQWTITNKAAAKVQWQIEGNSFLRRIDDLIFLVINSEGFGVYDNVWSANSQGIELGGKVKNLLKGLGLNANITYQSYFNTSDEGPFSSFKGDRIPNTPYFFANGGAEFQLNDVVKKDIDLSFFWNTRYVHSYFIGWESAGLAQYKALVPSQLTHATGITQKMKIKNTQNALTFQVQNLTNTKVFDMYGVQRPGRAYYLKLTTQF